MCALVVASSADARAWIYADVWPLSVDMDTGSMAHSELDMHALCGPAIATTSCEEWCYLGSECRMACTPFFSSPHLANPTRSIRLSPCPKLPGL